MAKKSLEKTMSLANLHRYLTSMTKSYTCCASQLSVTLHLMIIKVPTIAFVLMLKRLRRSKST